MLLGETDAGAWAGVISTVASGGFAGVVAWWLLTRALPKMQAEFKSALMAQQVTFERALAMQAEKHDRAEEVRRTDGKAGLDAVLEHCERESQRRDERHQADLAIVQKQLQGHGEILEEVRDRLLERDARRRRQAPPGAG